MKLSICIATRNRADVIGDTLQSLSKQWREGLELVVVDGASSDNTPEIVAEWAARLGAVRYIRKATNGGVDRDYDEAVREARGEYVWLMSDDDLFIPGAVESVIQATHKSPGLIVVNTEIRTIDFSRLLNGNRLGWAEDRSYGETEMDRLFRDVSGHLGYIGAVVMRRSAWLNRNRELYFGSWFIHVGVIFQSPLPGGAIVLAKPCVSVRFGNTQWRPREFEIRMIRWTDLIWSIPSVSQKAKEECYPRRPWRSVKSLFFYRAKGTFGLREYTHWVVPRIDGRLERVIPFLIAVFPGVLANLIGLLVSRMPYRESVVHYLDMKASRYYLPYVLKGFSRHHRT